MTGTVAKGPKAPADRGLGGQNVPNPPLSRPKPVVPSPKDKPTPPPAKDKSES
jgi:hypothetical protein